MMRRTEKMNEVKVLSNAISEAITAVKHAEKCCLDITTSDKLENVRRMDGVLTRKLSV